MRLIDLETRSAKIIRLLEKQPSLEIKELSKNLKVSTKTVQNEIQKLNDELDGAARLEIKRGVINLYIFNYKLYSEIVEKLIEPEQNFDNPINRVAYIADYLLTTHNFVHIDDLAFDLNVSRTTLNNDLKLLKKLLKEYDLEVSGRANTGIKISGKEYDIRRFIIENIFNIVYSKDSLDTDIRKIFSNVMEKYSIEDSAQKLISKYLVLLLDRYLNGFYLNSFGKDRDWLKRFKLFSIVDEILRPIEVKLNITFPDEELIFLLIPLLGMRTPVNMIDFENLIDIRTPVIELADQIIQTIKQETDISFQFDDTLDDFIYHINFLYNRLEFQMYLENPIKKEIKNKYGFAWSLAERAAEIIKKLTTFSVNEDEVGFLTTYFEIIIKEQKQRRRLHTKILVLHFRGGAARKLITYQLKKILSPDITVDFKDYFDLSKIDFLDYDLLITTGPVNDDIGIPVIELDEVVDEKTLKQEIDKLEYLNEFNLISNSKRKSILLSLLEEDKIQVFSRNSTYKDVLKLMIDPLINKNIADLNFFERLWNREKKATMDFSKSLSFPHTFHLASKKPFIKMGLTPNGLKDKKDVRLIILAGLPQEVDDDLTLVQLYEEILKIGESEKIVNELSQLNSYYELVNYLIIEKQIFN